MGLALAASSSSTYHRVKIGAVLVKDGRHVLSKAANLSTSHPFQRIYNIKVGRKAPEHNLHAEMHTLVRAISRVGKAEIRGCDIYIGRFDRKGNLAMCKPCPACSLALKNFGINKVYYTTTSHGVQSYEYVYDD